MTTELKTLLYGIDADKETSLLEYGLLIAPYSKDGNQDEYFCVYSIGNDLYDCGYKREHELNELLNGKEWADEQDINSFLAYTGQTLATWLTMPMVQKLSDCINYWGYENIMGACYSPIALEAAKERYL